MGEKIKVFMTMFNRHTWAIPLCEDFVKAGCEVILIDNKSTYPPMLEWYKNCPYKVHFMDKNYLAWAFFITELYEMYKDRYIIISDSDMDISKVPDDFVSVLFKGLESAAGRDHIWKSALSYELGDLPFNDYTEHARMANAGQFNYRNTAGFYECQTDLGIALYDRSLRGPKPTKEPNWFDSVRAPSPYTARHLDWYLTDETVRDEDFYYFKEARYFSYGCLWNKEFSSKKVENLHNYKVEEGTGNGES